MKISSALLLATCGLVPGAWVRGAEPVIPVPQSIRITGERFALAAGAPVWAGREQADPAAVALAEELFAGLRVKVHLGEAGDPVAAQALQHIPETAESYWLQITPERITALGRDGAGTFYALQTLRQLMERKADGSVRLTPAEVTDAPAVPVRGVVEGFYGKPWSHADRLRQLAFYGETRLNTYIYGPKDDPFHGFSNRWREPYPPEPAAQMRELVAAAEANHVRFVWAVHPGRDIRWDDTDGDGVVDDVAHCLKKFGMMYEMGVRSFAVFFDDIGGEGARAEKQVEMLNHLNRAFVQQKPDVRPLILCPTQYNRAWSGGDYLDILGTRLDPDIEIMWTGDRVCADITSEGMDWIAERIRRKALIWWNWPVSDYCRSRLLIGRTYGLETEAASRISGLVSNPMDKPEASKIGLFGVAAYTWNPQAFDSDAVWREGIERLFPGFAGSMQLFANHHSDQGPNTHGYRREESVEFAPVLEQAKREIEESGKLSAGSVSALRAEFTAMRTAAADIQQKLPTHNPAMWEEVECWVEAFDGLGATGLAAVDYWTAPSADVVNRLLAGFAAMEDAGERHRQKGLPDRWARAAVSGGTVVLPFLEWTLDQAAVKLAGGQEAAAAEPAYRAFSNIPALNELGATRDGIYVRLNPVREVIPVAPGQWIALALPPGVPANYVHLRLGDEKASERGEVQLSVDGESWQRQATRNQGAEMQSGLDPAWGFRFMRYINTSGQPVEVQFDLFKLDVPEDSRANLPAAMSDGQLSSYYTVPAGERVDPPQPGATQVTVLSPDPEALEEVRDRDGLHLRATREVRVHEILWR